MRTVSLEALENLNRWSMLVCNSVDWLVIEHFDWSPNHLDEIWEIYLDNRFFLVCSLRFSRDCKSNQVHTDLFHYVWEISRNNHLYFHRSRRSSGWSMKERIEQTDFGGELYLKGFRSAGAERERSFSSWAFPPLPSSRNGFWSKRSFGCMFNLNTPALSEALWCAWSFYSLKSIWKNFTTKVQCSLYSLCIDCCVVFISCIFVCVWRIFFKSEMWITKNQREREIDRGRRNVSMTDP